jgi:RNA polymerase sigma factor (sigma-70 family)
MDEALRKRRLMGQQDKWISDAINRDQARLRTFIRRRVPDQDEAEDILQDVFFELVEAYRLMKPLEQVTAWLFRVARNRIIDFFRKRNRQVRRSGLAPLDEDVESLFAQDLLPSADAGPEAAYARSVLLEELDDALDELPENQREVLVAHELMGYSFKELAAQWAVSVNTLLSRKHYAVLHLRRRLRAIYDEFKKR